MSYGMLNYKHTWDCDVCGNENEFGTSFTIQEDCEGQTTFEFVWICKDCLESYYKYKQGNPSIGSTTKSNCKLIDQIIELEKRYDEYQDKLKIVDDSLHQLRGYYNANTWKERYEREQSQAQTLTEIRMKNE